MKKILFIMVLVMVILLSVGCTKEKMPVGHYEAEAICVEYDEDTHLATFFVDDYELYSATVPVRPSFDELYIIEFDSLCDEDVKNDRIVRIRVDR